LIEEVPCDLKADGHEPKEPNFHQICKLFLQEVSAHFLYASFMSVLSEFKGESEKLELFEAVNLAGGFQVSAWRNGYL
jgi:hypothetical protein